MMLIGMENFLKNINFEKKYHQMIEKHANLSSMLEIRVLIIYSGDILFFRIFILSKLVGRDRLYLVC